MGQTIKEGKILRFRIAEKDDIDYIMEAEYHPDNIGFIIPDSREYHLEMIVTKDYIHLVINTAKAVGYLMIVGLDSRHGEIEWRCIVITKKWCGYGKRL